MKKVMLALAIVSLSTFLQASEYAEFEMKLSYKVLSKFSLLEEKTIDATLLYDANRELCVVKTESGIFDCGIEVSDTSFINKCGSYWGNSGTCKINRFALFLNLPRKIIFAELEKSTIKEIKRKGKKSLKNDYGLIFRLSGHVNGRIVRYYGSRVYVERDTKGKIPFLKRSFMTNGTDEINQEAKLSLLGKKKQELDIIVELEELNP